MKNKKFVITIVTFILVIVSIPIIGKAVSGTNEAASEAAKLLLQQDPRSETLFVQAYNASTESQRKELRRIAEKQQELGGFGQCTREILQVTGELPLDQPRITLEDARQIYEESKVSQNQLKNWQAEFDAIAGAPDYEGGSGISQAAYYLNDEGTEAIVIMNGSLLNYVYYDANGERVMEPFDEDGKPCPTSSTGPVYN